VAGAGSTGRRGPERSLRGRVQPGDALRGPAIDDRIAPVRQRRQRQGTGPVG
jgi:hypothetical protein